MRKILFILSFSFMLFADVLKAGITPNYAPYEFIENGELKGFDVDVVNEIAKRMNVDVKYIYMDFDALIPALKAKKIDFIASIMKKTAKREKSVLFSENVKDSINAVLYLGASVENTLNTNCTDKVNALIGAELSSVQYDYFKDLKRNVKAFNDINLGILALKNNKIDFLALDKHSALRFIEKHKELGIFCEYIDASVQGYVSDTNNKELIEKINIALKSMKEDGTLEKLIIKWGIKI